MTPPEIVLHRRRWVSFVGDVSGPTLSGWSECLGGPTIVDRCREDEHLVVVPKEALREVRRETLEEIRDRNWVCSVWTWEGEN